MTNAEQDVACGLRDRPDKEMGKNGAGGPPGRFVLPTEMDFNWSMGTWSDDGSAQEIASGVESLKVVSG